MFLRRIRNRIAEHLTNRTGWKTDRKIVVIESDDWGSIRMPSVTVRESLRSAGVDVHQSPYLLYDSLASEEDLEQLFSLLKKFSDFNGQPPVITADCVVANPYFTKIKESEFREYSLESISDTFNRYPKHQNCLKMWREGNDEMLFHPQLHGREHLNIALWLTLLQEGNNLFQKAFEYGCWGLSGDVNPGMERSVQAAFDAGSPKELEQHKIIIKDGLNRFEELFGYRSRSFIANNYIWDPALNETLFKQGVNYLQGMKYQKLPLYGGTSRKMIRHFTGEINRHGQCYLVRNCTFEPSLQPGQKNIVAKCLRAISTSFLWKRPAIICTHRINFVGFLDPKNRDRNLKMFEELLSAILEKWPDTEFMTSDQLGDEIKKETTKIFKTRDDKS